MQHRSSKSSQRGNALQQRNWLFTGSRKPHPYVATVIISTNVTCPWPGDCIWLKASAVSSCLAGTVQIFVLESNVICLFTSDQSGDLCILHRLHPEIDAGSFFCSGCWHQVVCKLHGKTQQTQQTNVLERAIHSLWRITSLITQSKCNTPSHPYQTACCSGQRVLDPTEEQHHEKLRVVLHQVSMGTLIAIEGVRFLHLSFVSIHGGVLHTILLPCHANCDSVPGAHEGTSDAHSNHITILGLDRDRNHAEALTNQSRPAVWVTNSHNHTIELCTSNKYKYDGGHLQQTQDFSYGQHCCTQDDS